MVVDYGIPSPMPEKVRAKSRLGSLPQLFLRKGVQPVVDIEDDLGITKSFETGDVTLAAVGLTNSALSAVIPVGKAWEVLTAGVRVTAVGGGVVVNGLLVDFQSAGTDFAWLACPPMVTDVANEGFMAVVPPGVYLTGVDDLAVLAATATTNPTVKVGLLVREIDDPTGVFQGVNV